MLTKDAQYFVHLCLDYLNNKISGDELDKKAAEFAARDDISLTDLEDTIINEITDAVCLYTSDAELRAKEPDLLDDNDLKFSML